MAKYAIGGSFQLCSCKTLQIFHFSYVSYALEFSSYIEMGNKFNPFIQHVIPHLPFAMAMFWGPFMRACP